MGQAYFFVYKWLLLRESGPLYTRLPGVLLNKNRAFSTLLFDLIHLNPWPRHLSSPPLFCRPSPLFACSKQ
jgi:hypothetical protein